jgi:hypothetical protein
VPRPRLCAPAPLASLQSAQRKNLAALRSRTKNSRCSRSADEIWFSRASRRELARANRLRSTPRARVFASAKASLSDNSLRRKNFDREGVCGRIEAPKRTQNDRIGPTDSLRQRVPRPRVAAHGVSARAISHPFSCQLGGAEWLRAAETNGERCRDQIPIRFLRRSLTTCGLALPPEAFIT